MGLLYLYLTCNLQSHIFVLFCGTWSATLRVFANRVLKKVTWRKQQGNGENSTRKSFMMRARNSGDQTEKNGIDVACGRSSSRKHNEPA